MTTSNINLEAPLPVTRNLVLDWENKDIEQRIGLTGGRFTRANTFFTLVIAIILTLAFYGVCFYRQGSYLCICDGAMSFRISFCVGWCGVGPSPSASDFGYGWAYCLCRLCINFSDNAKN